MATGHAHPDHPLVVHKDTGSFARRKARDLARDAHKFMLQPDDVNTTLPGLTERPMVARPLSLGALQARAHRLRVASDEAQAANADCEGALNLADDRCAGGFPRPLEGAGQREQASARFTALVLESAAQNQAAALAEVAACEAEEAVEEAMKALAGGGVAQHRAIRYGAGTIWSVAVGCDAFFNVVLFCRPGFAAPGRNKLVDAHHVNARNLDCARRQRC